MVEIDGEFDVALSPEVVVDPKDERLMTCVNILEHYEPEDEAVVRPGTRQWVQRHGDVSPMPGCTPHCSYNRQLVLVHVLGCECDLENYDARTGDIRPRLTATVTSQGSSGKSPTAADEQGGETRTIKDPTFESTPIAKPLSSSPTVHGRRKAWADRRKRREFGAEQKSGGDGNAGSNREPGEDEWDPLNALIFGPKERLTRSAPAEPQAGLGGSTRWFDRLVGPIFDPDEGAGGREVMGLTDYQSVHGEWIRVSSVMDSGACKPVCPPDMLPEHPVRPNAASRAKKELGSASGHGIKIHGEQGVKAVTDNGIETEVLFQVCDVTWPLVSISAVCDKGNRVIFGRGGGVIQNLATGAEVPFERRGGVYALGLWVRRVPSSDAGGPPAGGSEPPFGRR